MRPSRRCVCAAAALLDCLLPSDHGGGCHRRAGITAWYSAECCCVIRCLVQVAAFLLALQCCVQLDAHILNACASAMVDVALPCQVCAQLAGPCCLKADAVQVDRDGVRPMVDIVGTGGDGMDTFNVSTACEYTRGDLHPMTGGACSWLRGGCVGLCGRQARQSLILRLCG